MKAVAFLSAVALGAVTVAAAAALSSDDASFVQSAQHEALGEYALASLAKNKADEPAVKTLAAEVLANANTVNQFVRSYAASHDVTVDNKPSLRADEQYGNIETDSGKSFDQALANVLHIDLSIALDDYKDESQSGGDPALRAFAKEHLSSLEQFAAAAAKLSQ
jgi:putative membrane protein